MRRRKKRGISAGTVAMLSLVVIVLGGFAMLWPRLTGNTDIRLNASELAVAIDQSMSQIVSVASSSQTKRPSTTQAPQALSSALPPESLPTAVPPTAPPKYSFSLCATGNIKLNNTILKALVYDDGTHYDVLFENLATAAQADLSISTLYNTVIPSAETSNTNVPADILSAIRSAGINALNLGWTGVLDGGISGLSETKQAMVSAGIQPFGAYASAAEQTAGVMQTINNVNVAFLNFQDDLTSAGKRLTTDEERAFALSSQQLPTITAQIEAARNAGAQVVIVTLCWGKANATSPTSTQREMAQAIADAGADIILGTRPEALQTVEILTANRGDSQYHPVLCAYSLGNLLTYDREKRVSLSGALLRTEVVYDTATNTIAFDGLTYTPTYAWRGRENGVMRYRVLLNNADTGVYPDYVDADQQAIMTRCLKVVTDVMEETVFERAE